VLDAAARIIQPGVTTDEIDRVVHEATIAAGLRFPHDSCIRKLKSVNIKNSQKNYTCNNCIRKKANVFQIS